MKNLNFVLFLALMIGIGATSCKKAEEAIAESTPSSTPPDPSKTEPPSPNSFNTAGYDGMLVGIKTGTEIDVSGYKTNISLGTAVAYFGKTKGDFSSFVEAGTVKCENKELSKQDNNSYVFTNNADDYTGISFSGTTDWDISGSGSVPAFSVGVSGFPAMPNITSDAEITAGSDYEFKATNLSGADTVIFTISSGSTVLSKGTKGASGTLTMKFTAAETEGLSKTEGGALFQIASIKFRDVTISSDTSKLYLGVNESVKSQLGNVK